MKQLEENMYRFAALHLSTYQHHYSTYSALPLIIKGKVSMLLLRANPSTCTPNPSLFCLFRHCSSNSSLSPEITFLLPNGSFLQYRPLFFSSKKNSLTPSPSLPMAPFLFSLYRKSLHYLHFPSSSLNITQSEYLSQHLLV